MIEEVNKKPASDRSVGELVTDLTDEVKRLVRDEMRLAVFELQRKGKKMGLGAGLFGAAGLFAFLGAGTLVAAAVLALALAVPGWLAPACRLAAPYLVSSRSSCRHPSQSLACRSAYPSTSRDSVQLRAWRIPSPPQETSRSDLRR